MDNIRQIVVHFGDASPASQHALAVAAALARQHGARLSLRSVVESVASGAYLSPEAAALATQLVTEQMQTLKAQARPSWRPGQQDRGRAGAPGRRGRGPA
ncbi:MAG: universal stress protein [Inhella sp.]